MNRSQTNHSSLTEGSIARGILAFAWPVFLGQLLQQLYNMVDAWVIGNFASNDAFAAVGSSGNIVFLIVGLFNGTAIGGGVVIARYYGAGDREKLRAAIHTNFLFGLISSVAATVVGLAIIPALLQVMNTPESVLPYALQYYRIYFGGVATMVMYNICMSIMRALGDSRSPLHYLMISSALNVVLDLLFVAGFHWSVAGAAAATVIAQGVSVLLCIRRMQRAEDEAIRLDLRALRIHPVLMRQVLRQGLPSGIQNAVVSLGNVAIQSQINTFGSFAMSGHGAHTKIEGLAFLPIMSMSMTLPTFVSQNLGADKLQRAKKGAWIGTAMSVSMAVLMGIFIWFGAPALLGIFVDSPEAIGYGTIHARIVTRFYCLLAFAHCSAGVLRGCGKSRIPMVIMLTFWCVVRSIYVTMILKVVNEFGMISWAYPLTWSLSCIFYVLFLARMDWEKASRTL